MLLPAWCLRGIYLCKNRDPSFTIQVAEFGRCSTEDDVMKQMIDNSILQANALASRIVCCVNSQPGCCCDDLQYLHALHAYETARVKSTQCWKNDVRGLSCDSCVQHPVIYSANTRRLLAIGQERDTLWL